MKDLGPRATLWIIFRSARFQVSGHAGFVSVVATKHAVPFSGF
jgi:hypothetical protein